MVLNEKPVDPIYYLVSLPLVIVALYTPLSKHFLLKEHIVFFFTIAEFRLIITLI